MSLPPPMYPEQMATLPPEFRALLQAVIDHYARRIADLEAEMGALRGELETARKTP